MYTYYDDEGCDWADMPDPSNNIPYGYEDEGLEIERVNPDSYDNYSNNSATNYFQKSDWWHQI